MENTTSKTTTTNEIQALACTVMDAAEAAGIVSTKEAFILSLANFQMAEESHKVNKGFAEESQGRLKSLGATMAENLYQAIIQKEIDLGFLETLPELSRTAQGYISKARKLGFAVLENRFIHDPENSVMTGYDKLQKAEKEHKEANKLLGQRAARENAALLEVMGTQAEVNRVLTENGPELQAALQTGLAIIAEKEAKNLAEEKAQDLAKLVTETKANLAIIMETPFWQEMVDYVNQSVNSHKNASAA